MISNPPFYFKKQINYLKNGSYWQINDKKYYFLVK